jgi:hypothetical protein
VYTLVGLPLSRWNSIGFRWYHGLLEFDVKLKKILGNLEISLD